MQSTVVNSIIFQSLRHIIRGTKDHHCYSHPYNMAPIIGYTGSKLGNCINHNVEKNNNYDDDINNRPTVFSCIETFLQHAYVNI